MPGGCAHALAREPLPLAGEHQLARALPEGVQIDPFYDRTELVETTLHTVFRNLAEGAILVVLVLFAFMLSVRASLIVATVIPLSLLGSFLYLYSRGMSANLLSMGAVDFGIIVDGAVILVENVYRHMAEEKPSPEHVPGVVSRASMEVVRPILFSLSIIVAAMIPIFTLERVEGNDQRLFSQVVARADASFLLSNDGREVELGGALSGLQGHGNLVTRFLTIQT